MIFKSVNSRQEKIRTSRRAFEELVDVINKIDDAVQVAEKAIRAVGTVRQKVKPQPLISEGQDDSESPIKPQKSFGSQLLKKFVGSLATALDGGQSTFLDQTNNGIAAVITLRNLVGEGSDLDRAANAFTRAVAQSLEDQAPTKGKPGGRRVDLDISTVTSVLTLLDQATGRTTGLLGATTDRLLELGAGRLERMISDDDPDSVKVRAGVPVVKEAIRSLANLTANNAMGNLGNSSIGGGIMAITDPIAVLMSVKKVIAAVNEMAATATPEYADARTTGVRTDVIDTVARTVDPTPVETLRAHIAEPPTPTPTPPRTSRAGELYM